jgi:antitoxin PrlF
MTRSSRKLVAYSRVSANGKTVLPRAVREALGIKPGNTLRYLTTDAGVLIDKAPPTKTGNPFAVFVEWSMAADEKAYAELA